MLEKGYVENHAMGIEYDLFHFDDGQPSYCILLGLREWKVPGTYGKFGPDRHLDCWTWIATWDSVISFWSYQMTMSVERDPIGREQKVAAPRP